MVWGVVTPFGVGRLVRVKGNMDMAQYKRILQEGLLGTARGFRVDLSSLVFQRDNDPKHKSRRLKCWFEKQGLSTLVWPASTADVNIIENIWSHMKARLRVCGQPHNKEELWKILQEEWYRTDTKYIQSLYFSIPSRVQALLKAKGGNIPY